MKKTNGTSKWRNSFKQIDIGKMASLAWMVVITSSIHGKEAIAMRFTHSSATRLQFRFLQRQFLQNGDLPFTDLLTKESLSEALCSIKVAWKDRIYAPLVTLWVFLGQVLSADHSCRAAVARLIAHRLSQGQSPCSAQTGAYCQARQKLPVSFFSKIVRKIGQAFDDRIPNDWLWKGRRV